MKASYRTDLTINDLHRWIDKKASETKGFPFKRLIFRTSKRKTVFNFEKNNQALIHHSSYNRGKTLESWKAAHYNSPQ